MMPRQSTLFIYLICLIFLVILILYNSHPLAVQAQSFFQPSQVETHSKSYSINKVTVTDHSSNSPSLITYESSLLLNGSFENPPVTQWVLPGQEGVALSTGGHTGNYKLLAPSFNGIFYKPFFYQKFQMPSTLFAITTLKLDFFYTLNNLVDGDDVNDRYYAVVTTGPSLASTWITNPFEIVNGDIPPSNVSAPVNTTTDWIRKTLVLPLANGINLRNYAGANLYLYIYNNSNASCTPPDFSTCHATQFYFDDVNLIISSTDPPPTPNTNINISHIEITQAVQDAGNNVPLIAKKPTFVRVYVDCGAGCYSMPNVSGWLAVSGSTSGAIYYSGKTITAYHSSSDWTSQRGDLSKTLNFTVDPKLVNGNVTITAFVGSDSLSEVRTFQSAKEVTVKYVPINYKGATPSDRIHTAHQWAQQVWPTARINYIKLPSVKWDGPGIFDDKCWKISDEKAKKDCNGKALLKWLTEKYHPEADEYVIAWLSEEKASDFGNAGQQYGSTAWALDFSISSGNGIAYDIGARSFVHEVGHMLGVNHYPDDSRVYDCAVTRIHEWGLENNKWVKDPESTHDYMSYCGGIYVNNVWTSRSTYETIFSKTSIQNNVLTLQPLSTAQPYLIASGLVFTDDTATLDPVSVISGTTSPINPTPGTEYCLETQTASNALLASYCFDLSFVDNETNQSTGLDGYVISLPYSSTVASVILKKGATELISRTVSANKPVVTVLSPNGSETWTNNSSYTIDWEANDADNDELFYNVFYSIDGNNWLLVASTITETQVAINPDELPGGNTARIRVVASDGLNNTSDESDAVFTVESKGAQTYIFSPKNNETVTATAPLLLDGYAYDLEDGVLGGDTLSWSSNIDGILGTGSQIVATLSPGDHLITLVAIDSNGNTTQTTVTIVAESLDQSMFLPLIVKNN